jgi:protein arginine N-methyltransferase 2
MYSPGSLFLSIACQVIKLQLGKLGFDSEFLQCQIEVDNNRVWDGVRRKYWHGRDVYYLPRITWNQEFIGRKTKAHSNEEHVDMGMEEINPKRQRR